MTLREQLEDTEIALHIAQVDCEKWKARAIKLAKALGIRDCDIDDYKIAEHGRLIDADELLTKVEDYGEGQEKKMLIAPYYVYYAETIIPATERSNNADSD